MNARRDGRDAIVGEPEILVDYPQHMQQLAFVFVDALHLHVEKRGGVHADARALDDQRGEALLAGVLNCQELALRIGFPGELFKGAQFREIPMPAVADALRNPAAEARVGVAQPAAGRDPVRLVPETAREELVEVRHQIRLHQFGLQRRHAVDRMAAHNGKVRHPDHPLIALSDQ